MQPGGQAGPHCLLPTAYYLLPSECTQQPILPGGRAPLAFAAPSLLAAAMPVGGQVELVGALNWLIRSAGLVSWEDLFDGNGDPRDFEDVVRRKGLTVEQLRRAGVAEGVARRAGGLTHYCGGRQGRPDNRAAG